MLNSAFPPAAYRGSRHLCAALAALVALLMVVPGIAGAADLHATPSTFASMFSQAQSGDTVYLASGSYGSFSGGAKAGMVTVAADAGASPTMSGGSFGSSVRNITIKGVTFTGAVEVAPGSTPMNLVFDGDTWGNVGHAAHEGRLSIAGGGSASGNGVQIKNSTFGPGGCSDGIQDLSRGTEIGPGNEFKGIVQGGCAEHSDAIQVYGANDTYIHDNYLHDNEQGIMSPDGPATGYRIINNVIHTGPAYPCMHLGDTSNAVVTHNVCLNGPIRIWGGNQNVPSQNVTAQNNAADMYLPSGGCTGCTIDHDQMVSYTGGSGRCAYATASPKATATDGTDIGLNDCGATQPPPPPPPPPPADTTPPDTTITSGPADPTSSTSASFAFTATEANSVFECRVDSGAWADCTSPKAYSALTVASHTFSVRATDAAGNTDASPATRSFSVSTAPPPDTTAPDTTITSGPTGTTSDNSSTFAFTATEANSVFECRVDSGAWADCTSPKPYSGLTTGSHTFSVRATDAAGNTDSTPATQAWTIQSAPLDHQPAAAYTSTPASPTVGHAVSFDASSATCDDTPCTYTWEDDGGDGPAGDQWPLGSGKTMSFTFQEAGVKNVRVTVTDVDGDTATTMKAITVGAAAPPPDTTAPDTTLSSGPTGTTSDSTPTFAFTASESGSTFQCQLDSAAWASCTSPWTTATLPDGPHAVSVGATDAAGNADATPATRAFTVDTSAPNTTIDSAPPAVSPGSTATVAFSASESGATFECRLDGGAWAACTSPKTYTGLGLVQHTVDVRATDAAGNVEASPATATWTSTASPGDGSGGGGGSGSGGSGSASDTEAPTVTLSAPAAGATFTSTLNLAATASDNRGVSRIEFWFDGARVARDAAAPYAATFTADRSTSYGVHTVSVRAFDAAGNARSTAVTVSRVRFTSRPRGRAARAASAQARVATASDTRLNTLVPVSVWRVATARADGDTLLRGRGRPGRSAAVTLARCGDSSGAVAAVMQLDAGADGALYARESAGGLCVLRIKPFGEK